MGAGLARGILAGVTGALEGGIKGYSYENQQQIERQKLAQAQEIAELRLQVQQMIASMNEDGRNGRHDTPSGDTIVKEGGANTRAVDANQNRIDVANIGAGSRERVASVNNDARLSGIDRQIEGAFGRAQLAEDGRNKRWGTTSANARLQSDTTRRGQDTRSADSRFGVTTRDATERRGQDVSSGDRRYGADARTRLFDGIFNQPGSTPITGGVRPSAFPAPGTDPAVSDTQVEPQSAPPMGLSTPVSPMPAPAPAPASGGTPVTPVAPLARPGGGGPARVAARPNAALEVLTQQASAALAAFRTEQDPAKRAQLQQQLLELKRRKDALVAGGGQ